MMYLYLWYRHILGTCHVRTAVVPCAIICSDQYIKVWVRAKWNFCSIWIVRERCYWNGPRLWGRSDRGLIRTPFLAYIYIYICIVFLHDRSWISSRIKSISNELDIIIHVITSLLCCYCGVISNQLWRHQQNEDRASETRGRCVNIAAFIVIYGCVMSCKK